MDNPNQYSIFTPFVIKEDMPIVEIGNDSFLIDTGNMSNKYSRSCFFEKGGKESSILTKEDFANAKEENLRKLNITEDQILMRLPFDKCIITVPADLVELDTTLYTGVLGSLFLRKYEIHLDFEKYVLWSTKNLCNLHSVVVLNNSSDV